MALDPHVPTPHGVTADNAGVFDDLAGAGQPEIVFQMGFGGNFFRKTIHAFGNFHETFLALALLAAGGGDLDSQCFSAFKQRGAPGSVTWPAIEM